MSDKLQTIKTAVATNVETAPHTVIENINYLGKQLTRTIDLLEDLENAEGTETQARQDTDTTLQNNIDAEAQARQDTDTTLQNNIDAEAQARQDADSYFMKKNADSVLNMNGYAIDGVDTFKSQDNKVIIQDTEENEIIKISKDGNVKVEIDGDTVAIYDGTFKIESDAEFENGADFKGEALFEDSTQFTSQATFESGIKFGDGTTLETAPQPVSVPHLYKHYITFDGSQGSTYLSFNFTYITTRGTQYTSIAELISDMGQMEFVSGYTTGPNTNADGLYVSSIGHFTILNGANTNVLYNIDAITTTLNINYFGTTKIKQIF